MRRVGRRDGAGGVVEAGAAPARRWVAHAARARVRAAGLRGDRGSMRARCSVGSGMRAEPEAAGSRSRSRATGADLEDEVDLIEEVARVQGYDRVGDDAARHPSGRGCPRTSRSAHASGRPWSGTGLREARSFSFASGADLELMGDDRAAVRVANPLAAGRAFLRHQPDARTAARARGETWLAEVARGGAVRGRARVPAGTARRRSRSGRTWPSCSAGSAGHGHRTGTGELRLLRREGRVEALLAGFGVPSGGWARPAGRALSSRAGRAVVLVRDADGRRGWASCTRGVADGSTSRPGRALFELDDGVLPRTRRRGGPRSRASAVPAGPPRPGVRGGVGRTGRRPRVGHPERGGDLVAAVVLFDVFGGPPLPAGRRAWPSPSSSGPPIEPSPTRRREASVGAHRGERLAPLRRRAAVRVPGSRPLRATTPRHGTGLPLRRRPAPGMSSATCSTWPPRSRPSPPHYADRLHGADRRDDLREAVHANPGFVRGGGRSAGGAPAALLLGRAAAGPGRDDRGHRPGALPLRRRHRAADVRAGAARGARAGGDGPGRELAVGLRAPVPVPGRPAHGAGAATASSRAGRSPTWATATTSRTRSCSAARSAGMPVRVATPPGFEPIPQVVHRAEEIAAETGGERRGPARPGEAADGGRRPVHGRVGIMGQEDEAGRARPGVPGLPAGPGARRPGRTRTSSCCTACPPTGARRSPTR